MRRIWVMSHTEVDMNAKMTLGIIIPVCHVMILHVLKSVRYVEVSSYATNSKDIHVKIKIKTIALIVTNSLHKRSFFTTTAPLRTWAALFAEDPMKTVPARAR